MVDPVKQPFTEASFRGAAHRGSLPNLRWPSSIRAPAEPRSQRLGPEPRVQGRSGGDGAARPAAVLVPIVVRDELTVLLTQRSHDMPSHPGQISFPAASSRRRRHRPRLRAARGAGGDRPAARPCGAARLSSTAIAPAPASRSARWSALCGQASSWRSTPARCGGVRGAARLPDGPCQPPASIARVARTAAFLLRDALPRTLYLGRYGRHAQEPAREIVSAMIRVVIENILLFLTPMAIYSPTCC